MTTFPPRRRRILVVDDDVALGQMVRDLLGDRGFAVTVVAQATDALERIQAGEVEILVTDLRMPEMGGMELIGHALRHDPRIVAVAMTGFGDLETAVRAVRGGAFDYLPKPFEPDALLLSIDKSVAERAQREELASLRSVVHVSRTVVAKSAQMRDVMALVERVAPTPASVLITGPSGTGKELIARAVHERSDRANGPFVAVNCAAIPAELLESELFGVKRGAFTDARADRAGLFREANGGTIFLDELGDLPLAMQPKLLRVLQEREVRPLGGSSSSPIDVRVISATRHDLRKALAEGTFREDLFYRLAVVEVGLPALRERPDDIVPLAERALERACARAKRQRTLSGAAARKLLEHSWPGNVRELENAIERAVALSNGDVILPEDLPQALGADTPQDFLKHAVDRSWTLEELSRAYLARVLERTGGNKKQAAALMGIDRRTIQRWLGEEKDDLKG
ncbi:MAG: sigma-54-dependent Fis family transcriptional regulator [Myxococcales bacterium]|nr:sigma-54-dependent Fis family transcriptional regulator [Myxococcales bacterium]